MASSIHLIFIGTMLVIPTLIIVTTTEELEPTDAELFQFMECNFRVNQELDLFNQCTSKEFTEEKINASMALHNETKYVKSKHICRKQDEIFQCIGNSVEQLKSISNKTVTMIPFMGELLKESIRALCENDGELLSAAMKIYQSICFSSMRSECRPRLGAATDIRGLTCDFPLLLREDYGQNYICQKYLDFMKCAEARSVWCSMETKNAVTRIISKWEQETSCSYHLNEIPNN